MESLDPIKLGVFGKLKADRKYRNAFFRSKARDDIVLEIQRVIAERGISISDLAIGSGMKQSAVSRLLRADYSSWTFTTLVRIGQGLDACWEFRLRPTEDAMHDYDQRNEVRAIAGPEKQRDYILAAQPVGSYQTTATQHQHAQV